MPVVNLLQLCGVVSGSAGLARAGTAGWALLAFLILPSTLLGLFWHRAGRDGGLVPGAVDNLSGCSVVTATCAFLAAQPDLIPEDTEIRFISFGGEEAGLRGSRRYVSRHLAELKRLDARLLNLEMIAYPEIGIITSDRNGTLNNDPRMVESAAAAPHGAGVPHRVHPGSFGTCTDAVPFLLAGIQAITLIPFQFPRQLVGFYHQRSDTPEKVSIEALENVLQLTLEWIRRVGG